MKGLKMIGLAVLACAAVATVGSGNASATVLDCGGSVCAENQPFDSGAEKVVVIHTPAGDIECAFSTLGGVLNPGTSATTAGASLQGTFFEICNAIVTVSSNGTLEIHTRGSSSDNNGTVTSTGLTFTTEILGIHCIYKTSGTDVGNLTGSATTGGRATFDIEGLVPREGGRSGAFCGSTALWTGTYEVTQPSSLNVT